MHHYLEGTARLGTARLQNNPGKLINSGYGSPEGTLSNGRENILVNNWLWGLTYHQNYSTADTGADSGTEQQPRPAGGLRTRT